MIVRKETFRLVKPLFIVVQLSPLSVERKMPPPQVPAKISPLELMAKIISDYETGNNYSTLLELRDHLGISRILLFKTGIFE